MNSRLSTVLVVSSDIMLRHVLRIALRRNGCLVLSAENPSLVQHLCANIRIESVILDDFQDATIVLKTRSRETVLKKPVVLDELLHVIRTQLEGQQGPAQNCA